jgi:hypothetical protein
VEGTKAPDPSSGVLLKDYLTLKEMDEYPKDKLAQLSDLL